MKKLKLTHRERQEVIRLYQEDMFDDYIIDFFSYNYKSYFKKCEKKVCMSFGIALREAHTFSFDDYDIDSSDFYLELTYELLSHTNINKKALVH